MKSPKPRAQETGALIGVRLQAPELSAIDAWRKEQPDLPTRPEAIRRLSTKSLGQEPTTPEGSATLESIFKEYVKADFKEFDSADPADKVALYRPAYEVLLAMSPEDISDWFTRVVSNRLEEEFAQIGKELRRKERSQRRRTKTPSAAT